MNPQKSWIITLVQSHLPCFLFPLTSQTIKPSKLQQASNPTCPPLGLIGYIAMLAVEKELRGKRIGSKLVQLCLDRMRSFGCRAHEHGQDGQVKNTHMKVAKYDVAFKPRKWKVNFMTILKRSTPLKLLMFVGFLCSLRKLGAPGS